jgi:putative ABC transport system permease protein
MAFCPCRPSRLALLMLISAVGILFLIVCANVAHLQLGRSASRLQEFSIRKALGANRTRLVRQLLTESLLLSLLGGLLGFGLASLARVALLQFAPTAIPLYADLRIDTWVIVFSLAITLMAPLLFGIGPALASARPDLLRHHGRLSASVASTRVRNLLVSGEVALSVVLVVCAGLLIRSFLRLENADLGFRAEHALSFRLDPSALVSSEAQGAVSSRKLKAACLNSPESKQRARPPDRSWVAAGEVSQRSPFSGANAFSVSNWLLLDIFVLCRRPC